MSHCHDVQRSHPEDSDSSNVPRKMVQPDHILRKVSIRQGREDHRCADNL